MPSITSRNRPALFIKCIMMAIGVILSLYVSWLLITSLPPVVASLVYDKCALTVNGTAPFDCNDRAEFYFVWFVITFIGWLLSLAAHAISLHIGYGSRTQEEISGFFGRAVVISACLTIVLFGLHYFEIFLPDAELTTPSWMDDRSISSEMSRNPGMPLTPRQLS